MCSLRATAEEWALIKEFAKIAKENIEKAKSMLA
jgi:hypothetical protein